MSFETAPVGLGASITPPRAPTNTAASASTIHRVRKACLLSLFSLHQLCGTLRLNRVVPRLFDSQRRRIVSLNAQLRNALAGSVASTIHHARCRKAALCPI